MHLCVPGSFSSVDLLIAIMVTVDFETFFLDSTNITDSAYIGVVGLWGGGGGLSVGVVGMLKKNRNQQPQSKCQARHASIMPA